MSHQAAAALSYRPAAAGTTTAGGKPNGLIPSSS
jgi:hypothetical protein